jgi:hypothetical protein
MSKEKEMDCSFCNPKKKDWEEKGFYGYRCNECQGSTAFIVSSNHSSLTESSKKIVENLAKKHYPDLKIKWLSAKRKNMLHWYDFLVPK